MTEFVRVVQTGCCTLTHELIDSVCVFDVSDDVDLEQVKDAVVVIDD